ncbi:glycosyltransferase [Pelagibacteraceae bacterium]|nr:glycosyltransferase [Pelagibacteraceae bacterium]
MKKNNFPLISVIMNCYNGEKYLKKSIKSVLNQSYKKWELIFWDNKSKDNSQKIILNYKDKRIKYFKAKKFSTLYSARNLAIKKAKGQFISFLDTDDWWSKNKIFKQVQLIRKNKNVKFIFTNMYLYNEKTKSKKLWSKTKLPFGKITQNLLNDYKVGIITVMLRKNLFKKKKFNSKYNIIGDFDYFLKLSINEYFFCIQQPLAYYRIHADNYSKKYGIHSKELSTWININSAKMLKLNYSLNKIKLYNNKLKIKNFFKLGP